MLFRSVSQSRYAEAISQATKGKPSKVVWTDEMRQAKSEWRKQYHKDNPNAHPNRKVAGNRSKMTYPEQVAFDYLTSKGVNFEHQKYVLRYFPDFVVGNVIIEIDGEDEAINFVNEQNAGYGYNKFYYKTIEK